MWSFSFDNGFQGTDVIGDTLYVMVYAPDPEPPQKRRPSADGTG